MRLPVQVECIIFRRVNDVVEFLLLKRIESRGGFWQPVTGGLEENETVKDAVFRELCEETSLAKKDIIKVFDEVYSFSFESEKIAEMTGNKNNIIKEQVYGLEVKTDSKIVIDPKEHNEYKWVSYDEAMKMLKWQNNKDAFVKLKRILNLN